MYVAIDIETTGLDPETDQVLEFAAVLNGPDREVIDCPYFHRVVNPGRISGSAYALSMNARLLALIAKGYGDSLEDALSDFEDWLYKWCGKGPHHALGANVGTFDLKFLEKSPYWPDDLFHYRSLSVGAMYSTTEGIPGQCELAEKYSSSITGNEHEALYDARVSLALARLAWEKK